MNNSYKSMNMFLNKFVYNNLFLLLWTYIYYYLSQMFCVNIFFFLKLIYLNMNILGFSLLFSGILLGLFVLFLMDTKMYWYKNSMYLFMISFLFIIYYFMNETSYLMVFLYYELFLFPSFFVVYFISPNSRSIVTSMYFLMWTQLGSFFMFMLIMYIYMNTQSMYLYVWHNINYTPVNLLLFMGFGMKVPVWPFYYWLTKTHVEASSFFSIYLSGFLVKTAVYCFNWFYILYNSFFYYNLFYVIMFFGILDSSMKMWYQIDLKKLIAFSTVQEMNMILLLLLFNSMKTECMVALFMMTHSLLSSAMFFIVDVIYKMFATRSLPKLTGLVHLTPMLSSCVFLTILLFSSLPYTIKFIVELYTYSVLMMYDMMFMVLMLFMVNVISIVSIGKIFFNILFGNPMYNSKLILDLTIKELNVFLFLFFNLFITIYLTIMLF